MTTVKHEDTWDEQKERERWRRNRTPQALQKVIDETQERIRRVPNSEEPEKRHKVTFVLDAQA